MSNYPEANVETLLLTESSEDFYSSPRNELEFDFDGIVGDQRHRGRTMTADVRIKSYAKKQAEVLNRQTVSIIDGESLDFIGDDMELDPDVIAERYEESRRIFLARCIGANIVFNNFRGTDDIPEFHRIPNATDVGPCDPETGKFSAASLMITRYNPPCIHPGNKIETHYPGAREGLAQQFVRSAEGRRGFVGMVAKSGKLAAGDTVMFRPLPSAQR